MRTSAAEQDPRLSGDLGEHRRADMSFGAGTSDQLPELVDPRAMRFDPVLDAGVGLAPAARQELDPKLLEIAREPGRQQPLPLVGGNEAGDLLLRPVEAKRLAEPRIGSGERELVDLA